LSDFFFLCWFLPGLQLKVVTDAFKMVAVRRMDFYAALLVEGVLERIERDVMLDSLVVLVGVR
jgi:hypothetical protein